MEAIKPVGEKVLIEPILESERYRDHLRKKIKGFEFRAYEGFEGIPQTGTVHKLPDGYKGLIREGDTVVFSRKSPKGFKWDGKTLMSMPVSDVVAIMED